MPLATRLLPSYFSLSVPSHYFSTLPNGGAECGIHSHLLQDVLARLDKTYQAFFRRIQRGEKSGFPRFKSRNRFLSLTFKEYGNSARLENGSLVLAKIGRISVRWSRPLEGTPKTVTFAPEADRWYVAISCADAPVHALASTGQETVIDLGLESFATLANGQPIFSPRCYRTGEAYLRRCARRVARRGATADAKPYSSWRKRSSTSPGSGATFTTKKFASWCKPTM
jgi:putative transposase